MDDSPSLQSDALRVNLAQTRAVSIPIPPEHERLLEITASFYGIQARVSNFLKEFHHPYSNQEDVIRQLRAIVLGDAWLFVRQDSTGEGLAILADLFASFLDRPLLAPVAERTFTTLLEFMEQLARENPETDSLPELFDILEERLDDFPGVMIRSAGLMRRLCPTLCGTEPVRSRCREIIRTSLRANYTFWSDSTRLLAWYRPRKSNFSRDYAGILRQAEQRLFQGMGERIESAADPEALSDLPEFTDYCSGLRALVGQMDTPQDRIYFLFYLMHLPGMADQQETLLWDLNRELRELQPDLPDVDLSAFLDRIFELFGELKAGHAGTVLDCILTLGKNLYGVFGKETIETFLDHVVAFGYIAPRFAGISEDWQARIDPNHLKCLRTWLSLIHLNPAASVRLVAALIAHVKTAGMFVADTDLFQKDVTALLNADIAPCWALIKTLCRLFPVYFNEIGAEGELRQVTTRLDEMTGRRDRLIHFLRKQIHTESNNSHLELIRRILVYWHDGDPAPLEPFLPPDIRDWLAKEDDCSGEIRPLVRHLTDHLGESSEAILSSGTQALDSELEQAEAFDPRDCRRLRLLIRLYHLLRDKYSLDTRGIVAQMKRMTLFEADEIIRLDTLVAGEAAPEEALRFIFRLMARLKAVVLDPRPSEGREDIYYKRHVAAGIPSMYGSYREPKFESLGLLFRLEQLAATYMDSLLHRTQIRYINAKNLQGIARILGLFQQGLELEGLTSQGFRSNLEMLNFSLQTTTFSLDQHVNIFQFLSRQLKEIIRDYCLRPYEHTLPSILAGQDGEASAPGVLMQTERFYRDLIATTFLLQPLDNFLSRVLNVLRGMVENLDPAVIKSLMSYDPELISSTLFTPTPQIDNQVFLGAKAYYLKKLTGYGFPIPPGAVLTTELFRLRDALHQLPETNDDIHAIISRRIEDLEVVTGKRYGDPLNPLLLSVRSGGVISMPGAMSSFINVGLNDRIVEALAGDERRCWAAWDCYRRLLQSWGMARGISRDVFDRIIGAFKDRLGVARKRFFAADQMREIAQAYKEALQADGGGFVDDPFEQLIQAVTMVKNSWDSHRARFYRQHLQIADEWGTAVIIQQMVLGNLDHESGSGVLFTVDPLDPLPGITLTGDFAIRSQGDDVVSGLVNTLPVSEKQRRRMPVPEEMSLEKDFPRIYEQLEKWAHELVYARNFGHQEIEFTFESPRAEDLYLLQIRNYIARQPDAAPAFNVRDIRKYLVGTGTGIGGGALNGVVVFDSEDIGRFADKRPESALVLIRPDTVPDDIGLIFRCEGLLTARGGATSHSAVTAVNLGKTCVVNCRDLVVDDEQKCCTINGQVFRVGDKMALDGSLGNIYRGHHKISFEQLPGL